MPDDTDEAIKELLDEARQDDPDEEMMAKYVQQITDPERCLSEIIIARVQRILKRSFPSVGGLLDPVWVPDVPIDTSSPFLQMRYVNDNHWITISNMRTKSAETIQIYDSLPGNELSNTVKKTLVKLLGLKPGWRVETMNVTRQKNSADCGVHAIANAVALCSGTDPVSIQLSNTALIREHLLKCIKDKELSMFPHGRRGLRRLEAIVSTTKI